jgi:serine acetyltransferase
MDPLEAPRARGIHQIKTVHAPSSFPDPLVLLDCPFLGDQVIRGDKGVRPTLGARAFGDASAQVIGAVETGEDASVWMNAVVRGVVAGNRIGGRSEAEERR